MQWSTETERKRDREFHFPPSAGNSQGHFSCIFSLVSWQLQLKNASASQTQQTGKQLHPEELQDNRIKLRLSAGLTFSNPPVSHLNSSPVCRNTSLTVFGSIYSYTVPIISPKWHNSMHEQQSITNVKYWELFITENEQTEQQLYTACPSQSEEITRKVSRLFANTFNTFATKFEDSAEWNSKFSTCDKHLNRPWPAALNRPSVTTMMMRMMMKEQQNRTGWVHLC